MIDSDSVFMAGDLPHDVCANEAGAADNENSHSSQDKSGALWAARQTDPLPEFTIH